jgi:AcrR family transcriptional regulator
MEATARVLVRRGFTGTRLSDIAEAAGLQAASIYYHFASREDLIEAVIRKGILEARLHLEGVLAALPGDATPFERIDAAVAAHLTFGLEISDSTAAAIHNMGQLPPAMAERQRAAEEEYGSVWATLLEEAHDAGEFRPDVNLLAARMLVIGALNQAAEWWRPRKTPLKVVIATAQQMVRNALQKAE